jgi:succinylglutamate desuccinylase
MKNLILICCLHGNEGYGLEVCKNQSLFPFIFANKKSFKENKRFIDQDLNRSFPGKKEGNYEERLAFEIKKKLKKFKFIIDLHSSSNSCPMFGIITKPNKEKINFAKKIGLKKLVIMTPEFASGNSLIDFVDCGISIEIGPHERKKNIKETIQLLENLYHEKTSTNKIEIFEIFSVIRKKSEKISIENFQKIKKGDIITKNQKAEFDFIAILVNEKAYDHILCLAARDVTEEFQM